MDLYQTVLSFKMSAALRLLRDDELRRTAYRHGAYRAAGLQGDIDALPRYEFDALDAAALHAETTRRAVMAPKMGIAA